MGLSAPSASLSVQVPKDIVGSVENVTKLAFAELQKRTDQCNAYRAFLLQQIALCDVDILRCDRVLAVLRARVEEQQPARARWKVKGHCDKDTEAIQWFNRRDKAVGVRGLLDAMQESLDKKVNMLSREITRRQAEASFSK